jgi:hypothetical protein
LSHGTIYMNTYINCDFKKCQSVVYSSREKYHTFDPKEREEMFFFITEVVKKSIEIHQNGIIDEVIV